jgi:hypothetical protein
MFEETLECKQIYYCVMGGKKHLLYKKESWRPKSCHYRNYHWILEFYGDCMCVELVKRSFVTIRYFGYYNNVIMPMEAKTNPLVNGNKTLNKFDVEFHLLNRNIQQELVKLIKPIL